VQIQLKAKAWLAAQCPGSAWEQAKTTGTARNRIPRHSDGARPRGVCDNFSPRMSWLCNQCLRTVPESRGGLAAWGLKRFPRAWAPRIPVHRFPSCCIPKPMLTNGLFLKKRPL